MFKLHIETGNAAFGESSADALAEIDRILFQVCTKIKNGAWEGGCYDSNGNRVGEFTYNGR